MKIIFRGVVQGVGFRPLIYRIAKELGLHGYVLNKGGEVEVVIDGDEKKFIEEVKKRLPDVARIDEIIVQPYDASYDDFKIIESKDGHREFAIPVDTAICDSCLKEIFDKNNRRYLYPFTNCTICGARFSLIKDLPYDRENTSMDEFKMCNECLNEYKDAMNRRYHAQTISCPKCGPYYTLYGRDGDAIAIKNEAIKKFAEYMDNGYFGVIKSWGGMHLVCSVDKINEFRKWYGREQKPFAIMVRDIKTAEKYAYISEEEKKILLSKARPIVLLHKRNDALENASPGLPNIGIYLPYSALHHILFHYMKKDALLMTSANPPGQPMVIENERAFDLNADYYLLHNRKIVNRIDDSVLKIWRGRKFFIRKSRGFIPSFLPSPHNKKVIAVGAEENSSAAISINGKIYSTQYIGDTKNYDTMLYLENAIKFFLKLFKMDSIDAIVVDLHPLYNSRKVGVKLAEEYDVELMEVQHHWAHAVSLLLDNSTQEAVVLTLDGLGYGSDGMLWGGEVLHASFENFERIGHLKYIPLIGGDAATKDIRRIVFSIFDQFGEEIFFYGTEASLMRRLAKESPLTSSMGRVLDALSCYLGICTKSTYDGEAAMKLEKYLEEGKEEYEMEAKVENGIVDTVDLFRQLHENGVENKANAAYSFVKALIDALSNIAIDYATRRGIESIGITGGVSYSLPLVSMLEENVKKAGLHFLVHNRIPNGDNGIAVGQNVIGGINA